MGIRGDQRSLEWIRAIGAERKVSEAEENAMNKWSQYEWTLEECAMNRATEEAVHNESPFAA